MLILGTTDVFLLRTLIICHMDKRNINGISIFDSTTLAVPETPSVTPKVSGSLWLHN